LMHPSWIPTTITTGSCSCTTHSDSGRNHSSGCASRPSLPPPRA
jgi:hypothetical protein